MDGNIFDKIIINDILIITMAYDALILILKNNQQLNSKCDQPAWWLSG